MSHDVSPYYVAYFDVLGYKSFFEDKEIDITEFLNYIVSLAEDVIKFVSPDGLLNEKFQIKTFSDNFVFLLDTKNDEYQSIKSVSILMGFLQLRFLEKYKILIRGAITKGNAYIDDNIVFGEALIRAIQLEESSKYPRIVIDNTKISNDTCSDLCEKCLSKDDDEQYYVNFFDFLEIDIINNTEVTDNKEKQHMIIKKNIIILVKKYGKYNRQLKDLQKINQTEKTIEKYLWLLMKYNNYAKIWCDDKYLINYEIIPYPRLMKFEISLIEDNG